MGCAASLPPNHVASKAPTPEELEERKWRRMEAMYPEVAERRRQRELDIAEGRQPKEFTLKERMQVCVCV